MAEAIRDACRHLLGSIEGDNLTVHGSWEAWIGIDPASAYACLRVRAVLELPVPRPVHMLAMQLHEVIRPPPPRRDELLRTVHSLVRAGEALADYYVDVDAPFEDDEEKQVVTDWDETAGQAHEALKRFAAVPGGPA